MLPSPPSITVTPAVRAVLEDFLRRQKTPLVLARRSALILAMAEKVSNGALARRFEIRRNTVMNWRARWLAGQDALDKVSAEQLSGAVAKLLADKPKSGHPPVFKPEQVAAIVALACEPPENAGVPISHWSCEALAEEAVRRGIAKSISHQTVWRFLKSGRAEAAQGAPLAQPQAR